MNEVELDIEAKELARLLHLPEKSAWERHRLSILRHIEQGDIKADFLRWSTVQATMFVGDVPYVRSELREILSDTNVSRWIKAMTDSHFGNPDRFEEDRRFTGSSIHQAYHLRVWERASGQRIEDLHNIVEFGGGYGQMCAIAHRLGFHGNYTLFDFPEFLMLQRFYLENIGLPQDTLDLISYRQVDSEDRFQYPPSSTDLLIGCYSLCEAPAELRRIFFDVVSPKSCLIATHDSWDGADMHKYFDTFMRQRSDQYVWHKRDNKNIPGHFYVVGVKK